MSDGKFGSHCGHGKSVKEDCLACSKMIEMEGNKDAYIAHLEGITRDQARTVDFLKAEVDRLTFLPGHFECRKCGFYLVSNILYVDSGTVGANTKPQACANGCGPMWRVSREAYCKSLLESEETCFKKIRELEGRISGFQTPKAAEDTAR